MNVPTPTWSVLARDGAKTVVVGVSAEGEEISRSVVSDEALADLIRSAPKTRRWVWNETTRWYPDLLSAGVEVARCQDLRLCHAIIRGSAWVESDAHAEVVDAWAAPPSTEHVPQALFDLADDTGVPHRVDDVLAEFRYQQAAVNESAHAERLRLLLAAESAGALIAVELHHAGLPWNAAVHDAILTRLLGPRPTSGALPERVQALADAVRTALGDPRASLDSQPKLLRALHRVGVDAKSTSRWELAEFDHPAIAPLLAYKKATRLLSANGWAWLEEWAPDGRFRPVYVPSGVVTGRWASSGGGALQIPRQLRAAVKADDGWTLVVADVAQLEPRVLAAMARDMALADAARGKDLYEGVVAEGVVASRQEAKIALLGAMYGATTGDSGRLVPALRRAYPRAMGLVDAAAREGEQGGVVTTWLGRTSPLPSAGWRAAQARASDVDAAHGDDTVARRAARDRGRFTRNFVVQGTAAEWAAAWLADLRATLAALPPVPVSGAARASGPLFSRRAHLAFFLHDEIIIHAPRAQAAAAAEAARESAARAGRLLFGDFPLDFPLDLRIGDDASKGE